MRKPDSHTGSCATIPAGPRAARIAWRSARVGVAGAGVVAAPHREGGEGKGDDGERTEPVAGGVGLHEPNRRNVANRGHGTRRSSYELLAEERAGILGP